MSTFGAVDIADVSVLTPKVISKGVQQFPGPITVSEASLIGLGPLLRSLTFIVVQGTIKGNTDLGDTIVANAGESFTFNIDHPGETLEPKFSFDVSPTGLLHVVWTQEL